MLKKFYYLVSFYILFLAQCIGSTITLPLNIQSIKNNLNKILHTNGDIHIITLTRNFGSPEGGFYPGFSLFPIGKLDSLNQKLNTYIKKYVYKKRGRRSQTRK